jgi:peptidoglycan/LPS O-acetylase OafA/YrhL
VTIALAASSYYLIEQPAVRLKKRVAAALPPARSVGPAEAREAASA